MLYPCSFRVRDVTGVDGGEGVFSRMHHEMESVIRVNEMEKSRHIQQPNIAKDDKA